VYRNFSESNKEEMKMNRIKCVTYETADWLTKPLLLFVAFLVVAFMVGCGGSGGGSADNIAPTVSSVAPANAAIGIALNSKITATFSEAMNPATITTSTFTLKQGTTVVSGVVTYAGTTAIFKPTNNLAVSTTYTASVTTGVTDLAGNALAVAKTWSFTTGTTADTTAPTVSSIVPSDTATGVARNSTVIAIFSKTMDASTISTSTFTLKQGTTVVPGVVSYLGTTAIFTPASSLAVSAVYTATVTTGVTDLSGNALAVAKTWSFTTGTATDTTAPTVSSISPLDAATGVTLNSTVNAIFSKAMSATTINASNFTLMQGPTAVAGTVTYAGTTTARFTPASNLVPSTVYTATITTGVKDLAGNALAANKVWSFTTGTTTAAGPAPVLLGTAGNFVILAKTAVSTVPTSVITGDVGVSPAATSYLTGFGLTMVGTTSATSTQVIGGGSLYGADMTVPTSSNLTTAVLNMEAAYTDAAGRPTPDFLNLGAGEIGGLTLVPGLYNWTTGVTISTPVTITGGANDVWIFQIPGNLTMSNAQNVILGGSAKAKNIFWQVAGFVELGTTAHFEGILLSQTEIRLRTGATMNGRALAQTQVTLDQSTVTTPAP
jgi:hypothetical protein